RASAARRRGSGMGAAAPARGPASGRPWRGGSCGLRGGGAREGGENDAVVIPQVLPGDALHVDGGDGAVAVELGVDEAGIVEVGGEHGELGRPLAHLLQLEDVPRLETGDGALQ